ncbi:MOSC domain-containing protein [Piscinibacter sakaiensis]|uniref:MOSC domain-containing protein n=1 Tax=Piscinibacter sakaiensis TaxID=1547922 RepID=A0A0K8P2S9_PISS1|nr:MOSC domain-containing protein [Piscinibacter sakaiensis]GAP36480.1 hypothetical protein ISF6_2320 [Piscinibacter sakaiensis]
MTPIRLRALVRPPTPAVGGADPAAPGAAPGPVAADARPGPDATGGLDAAGLVVPAAATLWALPAEHLPFWQTVRAQAGAAAWGAPLPAGLLGEQLLLEGLPESRAWFGDVLEFPDCALAVGEPREPDPGFSARLGFAQAGRLARQSGWCGYALRVRRPGTLAAGQVAILHPGPREISVAELWRARRDRAGG